MSVALQRRLEQIEAELAKLMPAPSEQDEAAAWLAWVSHDDLDWLEQVHRRCVEADEALTPREQARYLAIEADAIQRMLAGEPDSSTQHVMDIDADILGQRRQGKALWLGFDPRTDPVYEGPPAKVR
jgi:hypothetical protein